jgi:hypothetical protein
MLTVLKYQEQKFAGRNLTFTNDQVYFICLSKVWSEDVIEEKDVPRPDQMIIVRPPPAGEDSSAMTTLTFLISIFKKWKSIHCVISHILLTY